MEEARGIDQVAVQLVKVLQQKRAPFYEVVEGFLFEPLLLEVCLIEAEQQVRFLGIAQAGDPLNKILNTPYLRGKHGLLCALGHEIFQKESGPLAGKHKDMRSGIGFPIGQHIENGIQER